MFKTRRHFFGETDFSSSRRGFLGGMTSLVTGLLLGLGLFAGSLTITGEAQAAKVLTIENAPIEATLSLAEIKKRIIAAGAKRGWRAKEVAPGHLEAMIHVRTHTAKVDIRFDTKSYSIFYKDSTNLKYKNGKIHRAYNNWVTNLSNDIQLELSF